VKLLAELQQIFRPLGKGNESTGTNDYFSNPFPKISMYTKISDEKAKDTQQTLKITSKIFHFFHYIGFKV
jgi:hypothetical protein